MKLRLLCALLLAAIPTILAAAPPEKTCPSSASGWFLADRDLWWANTVSGLESSGIDVYDGLGNFTPEFDEFVQASFGYLDGQAFMEFVIYGQWPEFDKNGNGFVCMKFLPETPGIAAYFFGGVDDQAAVPPGQSGK